MGTEEVPSIADVLLTLLKRYLISNGVGLISHRVLMELNMEFLVDRVLMVLMGS